MTNPVRPQATPTRQQFLRRAAGAAAAAIAAPLWLPGCAQGAESADYLAAVKAIWHPASLPRGSALADRMALVHHATLAPSSHNTQCWRFLIERDAVHILPDFARRCPAVDPDDHHLFVSLGCAAENLVQAGRAIGLEGEPRVEASGRISIPLAPTRPRASPLFEVIAERQNTRTDFDGKPLSAAELRQLTYAALTPDVPGVRLLLLTDRPAMEKVLALVLQGNDVQMADPDFLRELKTWLRFNSADAVRSGDGLYSATSGTPSLPRWLGEIMFDHAFSAAREDDKYAGQVRSSAGLAVFMSEVQEPASWVAAGRSYQRFALQATALGIRHALLNQAVEVPAVRAELVGLLGSGAWRPDMVVRFGRGSRMPQSLRRPVGSVLR